MEIEARRYYVDGDRNISRLRQKRQRQISPKEIATDTEILFKYEETETSVDPGW